MQLKTGEINLKQGYKEYKIILMTNCLSTDLNIFGMNKNNLNITQPVIQTDPPDIGENHNRWATHNSHIERVISKSLHTRG